MHRQRLPEAIAGLKARLETQATLDSDDDGGLGGALLRSRWRQQGGQTACSPLSPDPAFAIALAARRALACTCWEASADEVEEERATAARVHAVLRTTEVEECAYAQALVLADPENGVGDDGTMNQCFYCQNYGDCATEVTICQDCICVFHEECLQRRDVPIPVGDAPLTSDSCPVCMERLRVEQLNSDPARPSVLSLTARGSYLTATFPAVSKRARTSRSGQRVCSQQAAPARVTRSALMPPAQHQESSPVAAEVLAAEVVAAGAEPAVVAAPAVEPAVEPAPVVLWNPPPSSRAELLDAVADRNREFGLLTSATSTLAAPAFAALQVFCAANCVPLPAAWPAHKRGQPLPEGCFIVRVRLTSATRATIDPSLALALPHTPSY